MPAVSEIHRNRDEELLLVVERDIPGLHDKMTTLEQKQNNIEDKVNECAAGISNLSGKMDLITIEVKSIKDKDQLPYWRDFQKVLILILVLGFMLLAGVKGAKGILNNLNPLPAITVTDNIGG